MSCPIKSMRKNEQHRLKSHIMFPLCLYFRFQSKTTNECAKREGKIYCPFECRAQRMQQHDEAYVLNFSYFDIFVVCWLTLQKFTTVLNENDASIRFSLRFECMKPMCLSKLEEMLNEKTNVPKLYQNLAYKSRLNACFANDEHYRWSSWWWSIIHGLHKRLVQSYVWRALEIWCEKWNAKFTPGYSMHPMCALLFNFVSIYLLCFAIEHAFLHCSFSFIWIIVTDNN